MRLTGPPLKGATDVSAPESDKFTLPVATRAAAAAAAPEMSEALATLLRLCSNEPVTAVVAVADALSRRNTAQCVPVPVPPAQCAQACPKTRAVD